MAKRIYVGNLSFEITDEDLAQLFGQCGHVSEATVIKDKVTGYPKGFGFVEMPNDDEATHAVARLKGQDVKGRPIVVDFAEMKPVEGAVGARPDGTRQPSREPSRRAAEPAAGNRRSSGRSGGGARREAAPRSRSAAGGGGGGGSRRGAGGGQRSAGGSAPRSGGGGGSAPRSGSGGGGGGSRRGGSGQRRGGGGGGGGRSSGGGRGDF